MQIVLFKENYERYKQQVADMMSQAWPADYPQTALAKDIVGDFLEEGRIGLVAVLDDKAVGYIGAIPQYDKTGWELHPLVIAKDYRGRGIGTKLLATLEAMVAKEGGVSLYLGSDDKDNSTSLGGVDLYSNLLEKIDGITNLKNHPYEFYQKNGYQIVGVIPDASGYGKPDIFMAKRLINAL